MQINRLIEMIYILLEKKTITAKELAEKFEVSTRTIYRDIDTLSTANIPIYCNKGRGGGICLVEDFVLDKSILSEKEQKDILSALQGLEQLNVGKEKETLEKMSRIFKKNNQQWLQIDFSEWSSYPSANHIFEILKEAILNQNVITFLYYNSKGEETARQVEPLQIQFKAKAWYLIGYCRHQKGYRIFKINRMKEIKVEDETFDTTLPEEEQTKETVPIKMVSLELEIAKAAAYRVYDEFQKEAITIQENGDFLITIEYPENDWVYGYLLSFGEYLKVIAPAHVKQTIQQQAEKIVKQYKI